MGHVDLSCSVDPTHDLRRLHLFTWQQMAGESLRVSVLGLRRTTRKVSPTKLLMSSFNLMTLKYKQGQKIREDINTCPLIQSYPFRGRCNLHHFTESPEPQTEQSQSSHTDLLVSRSAWFPTLQSPSALYHLPSLMQFIHLLSKTQLSCKRYWKTPQNEGHVTSGIGHF